jgi:type II secretory pathway pseudopilin PulG
MTFERDRYYRPFGASTERAGGFSLIELLVVVVVLIIVLAISVPYIYNYQRLYKSEDQSRRVMDLMREASQLALTRRHTYRFEIDLTDNAMLIIDENAGIVGNQIKSIPLESPAEIRMDTFPVGIPVPNPPNYNVAAFANDTVGHLLGGTTVTNHVVWAARFRSDGSVVTATNAPVSATLYVWPPDASNSTIARHEGEIRAITIYGGSGAVRYWKYTTTGFVAY